MSDNCNCGCENHTHHTDEESKYDFVIAEYSKAMTDEEVAKEVKRLIEDKVEEKTRIIYKDRLVLKDSLVYVEKPVPVEIIKEKKVYPRFLITMSILGIVFCLLFLFLLYEKLKKKLPL